MSVAVMNMSHSLMKGDSDDDFARIFRNCGQHCCWADEVEEEELRELEEQRMQEDAAKQTTTAPAWTSWSAVVTKDEVEKDARKREAPSRSPSPTLKKRAKAETSSPSETEEDSPMSASSSAETVPAVVPQDSDQTNAEAVEAGTMLFVGGVIFADLDEKENGERLKEVRAECMEETLKTFGPIISLKARWKRRYCHVVYEDEESANKAFVALTKPEVRKDTKDSMKRWMEAKGFPREVAPTRFYARWPKKAAQSNSNPTQAEKSEETR